MCVCVCGCVCVCVRVCVCVWVGVGVGVSLSVCVCVRVHPASMVMFPDPPFISLRSAANIAYSSALSPFRTYVVCVCVRVWWVRVWVWVCGCVFEWTRGRKRECEGQRSRDVRMGW